MPQHRFAPFVMYKLSRVIKDLFSAAATAENSTAIFRQRKYTEISLLKPFLLNYGKKCTCFYRQINRTKPGLFETSYWRRIYAESVIKRTLTNRIATGGSAIALGRTEDSL